MNIVTREDITCKELVELVTAYLENALSAEDHASFEEHIGKCAGCSTYVEQIRLTIAAAGKVTPETIEPAARDELLATFRSWHSRDL